MFDYNFMIDNIPTFQSSIGLLREIEGHPQPTGQMRKKDRR